MRLYWESITTYRRCWSVLFLFVLLFLSLEGHVSGVALCTRHPPVTTVLSMGGQDHSSVPWQSNNISPPHGVWQQRLWSHKHFPESSHTEEVCWQHFFLLLLLLLRLFSLAVMDCWQVFQHFPNKDQKLSYIFLCIYLESLFFCKICILYLHQKFKRLFLQNTCFLHYYMFCFCCLFVFYKIIIINNIWFKILKSLKGFNGILVSSAFFLFVCFVIHTVTVNILNFFFFLHLCSSFIPKKIFLNCKSVKHFEHCCKRRSMEDIYFVRFLDMQNACEYVHKKVWNKACNNCAVGDRYLTTVNSGSDSHDFDLTHGELSLLGISHSEFHECIIDASSMFK